MATGWTGRSSKSPVSLPMRKLPGWMRTNFMPREFWNVSGADEESAAGKAAVQARLSSPHSPTIRFRFMANLPLPFLRHRQHDGQ